jgi:hypothetical protein
LAGINAARPSLASPLNPGPVRGVGGFKGRIGGAPCLVGVLVMLQTCACRFTMPVLKQDADNGMQIN